MRQVVIRATGLGMNGVSSTALQVKIGEAYATADSVQPVADHAGLYAIQFRIPAAAAFGDAVPVALELTSNGRPVTSNAVTAAIEPVRQ